MPNWCCNRLTIKGDQKQLIDFKKKYMTENEDGLFELDFQKILPEPKTRADLKKIDRKYITNDSHSYFGKSPKNEDEMYIQQHFDWYEWRCDNWGTKWEPSSISTTFSQNQIDLSFETAWSPPEGIIGKLMLLNPTLEFKNYYYEPGMMFAGCMGSENYEIRDQGNMECIRWAVTKGLESQDYLDELIEENRIDGEDLTR